MTFQKKLSKFPIFLLLMLLVFSPLAAAPARAQVVVRPYDWVKTGAYAKYFGVYAPNIEFPNGTQIYCSSCLYSPLLFDWTIVNKQGSKVRLNVTLFFHGWTWTFEDGFKRVNVTYHKTLLVDVDVYTRESFIDNEPIGKTCFWADPYKEIGDKVTVFSDPDQLQADVWWTRTARWDYVGKEFKMYGARLRTEDPTAHVLGSYVYSWYTGVAIEPTFLGPPKIVPPEWIGRSTGHCRNGTDYNITRWAGTKLGTHLGLAPSAEFAVDLNETNIDLTLETEPGPPSEPLNLWQYLPYVFVATFITTATSFIILRKRKHNRNRSARS